METQITNKGLMQPVSRNYVSVPADLAARPAEIAAARCSPSALIGLLFEFIDASDWRGLERLFVEDSTYERPGYEPMHGRSRIVTFYHSERVVASGTHRLEGIIADDVTGAAWGRFTGIHRNGSCLDERFADCYTFVDGRILARRSYFYRPAI